jgi:PAS domain S-box-containing protein
LKKPTNHKTASFNYEDLIDLSDEIHLVIDFKFNILKANSIFFNSVGYSEKEVDSIKFNSLIAGKSKFDKTWGVLTKISCKKTLELSLKTKDNGAKQYYWRFKSDTKNDYVYVVGNEITDSSLLEHNKLSQALEYLGVELSDSKSEKSSTAMQDIQRILSEKVDKFKLISENVSDLVCLHEPINAKYLYCSPSVTEVTGYQPEDLIGKSPYDFFHPDVLKQLAKDHERSQQAGEEPAGPPPKMEFLFRSKHKGYRWIESHSRPIFDDDGNVILILSTSRDITAKKEAEEEKEKFFNYYKILGNNLPNGAIFLVDTDFRFIIAEGEEFKLIDRPKEYFVGKTIYEVYEKNRLDYLKPYFEDVINEGKSVEFEYPFKGQTYIFRGAPGNDHNGNIVAGIFLTQNITESKQFEQQLKDTIHQLDFQKSALDVAALVSETNNEGVLTYVNKKYCSTSSYKEKELLGKHYSILNSDDHSSEFYEKLWSSISEGNVWNGEIKNKSKDGSYFWTDTWIIPFKDVDGDISKHVFIELDITQRKQVQESLKIKNYELDSFAYHASHDLRAPLSSILGLTHIISMEDNIGSIKNMVRMIEHSVNKQDIFIKSILAYSQNENLDVVQMPINFKGLISSAKQELKYLKNYNGVYIETQIVEKEPFYSDTLRISIILKNIISNTIKYADLEKDKSSLSIDITSNKDGARMVFEDNGLGIEDESKARIFEMFYRGNEISDGSGLGLYIVNETVGKLKGTIEITSTVGEGTSTTIFLPHEKKHNK